jgi:excinuclease UvrABC helicase subunit UvrB
VPEKAPAESQVRKSPRKKVPSVVVASTFDEVTMDMNMGVRKSPRKRTTRPNYTEEQVIESPAPVKLKLKDVTSATTETTAKRRRSLKPIEGGLVMRTQVEAVETIDSLEPNDAEERPSAERVEDVLEQENEMEARGIREGEYHESR